MQAANDLIVTACYKHTGNTTCHQMRNGKREFAKILTKICKNSYNLFVPMDKKLKYFTE